MIVLRTAVWLVPLVATYAVVIARRRHERLIGAVLLGIVWNGWSVLAVNLVALEFGWWRYQSDLPAVMGVAVEPWLGWTLLWGAVVPLLVLGRPALLAVLVVAWLDLVAMPALEPVVYLGDGWLLGEILALAVAVFPGLVLVRWTMNAERLFGRVYLQIACFGAALLWLVPTAALVRSGGWRTVLDLGAVRMGLLLQVLLLPAALGFRAVIEFAGIGRGTPIPYDPPKRVVTSGPFSYVRNPMQLAMVLVYLLAGLWLWNVWLVGAAAVAFVYGAGLATWHEDVELARRHGEVWHRYKAQMRPWLPRWRPLVEGNAELLVAFSCATCSSIGRWFLARDPIGLRIMPAEESGDPGLRRVTYMPAAGGPPVRGVRAIARALEHINLGWALVGWILELPGVSHLAQLLADVFGPAPHPVAGLPFDPAACRVTDSIDREIVASSLPGAAGR